MIFSKSDKAEIFLFKFYQSKERINNCKRGVLKYCSIIISFMKIYLFKIKKQFKSKFLNSIIIYFMKINIIKNQWFTKF